MLRNRHQIQRARYLPVLALAAMAASSPLRAQSVGDRVRVTVPDTMIVGLVTDVSDEGFELVRGDMRRYFRRALAGGAIGGAVGGLVGYLVKSESWTSLRRDGSEAGGTGPPAVTSRPVLFAGDRVRVSVAGRWRVGQVRAASRDGFDLVQDGAGLALAYHELDALEVSQGMQRHWLPGLLIGFFGGAILKTGIDGSWECWTDGWCSDEEENRLILAGGIGGALGAGAGAMITSESWVSLPLPDPSVSFNPIVGPQIGPDGRAGLLLGARVRF